LVISGIRRGKDRGQVGDYISGAKGRRVMALFPSPRRSSAFGGKAPLASERVALLDARQTAILAEPVVHFAHSRPSCVRHGRLMPVRARMWHRAGNWRDRVAPAGRAFRTVGKAQACVSHRAAAPEGADTFFIQEKSVSCGGGIE